MPVFPCTVRVRWTLSHSISGEKMMQDRSPMTVRSWSRSWRRPTDVSSIRNRLCRSCVNLAGYTLGRSDLVRRAMSKKKARCHAEGAPESLSMEMRQNGVPGCINNGIDEKTANKIYDEMIDFAKYAFNKSHAAAYAVVSYQTAYLKYYYPVEYMAALMTSVIENPSESGRIYLCLPADEYSDSVTGY